MDILYSDDRILVCVKPVGVLSTDEPGGLPSLLRQALGQPDAVIRTVHRLDRAVSGLMVLARTSRAAAELSEQIRAGSFEKEYLAVVHGKPPACGTLRDLLARDKTRRMTFAVSEPSQGAQEACLDYQTVAEGEDMTRIRIRLHTGRTHQIRVQFSSRGWPLVGEKKYADGGDDCELALWSCALRFCHPRTGERLSFELEPPKTYPWTEV